MTPAINPVTLYGFWRSNATYRVRVALNLKGVPYREIPVDLDAGEQHSADFLARNPFAAVPALVDGDAPPITQSLALLEYIEERYPEPPLLPPDARGRARVRAIACDVACDSHPLIVPRVRMYLTDAGFDAERFRDWLRHWTTSGLQGIEAKLASSPDTGRFCQGDQVTIADICVAGLAMIPRLFKFDVPRTPTVTRVVETCLAQEAFAEADPLKQVGAPRQA